jgi:Photosynthetic reaction centre cytochrome C subunit
MRRNQRSILGKDYGRAPECYTFACMRKLLAITAFSVSALVAQTPSISGVWKADLEKSNFGSHKVSNYLVLIEQDGSKVTETVGAWGEHGQDRQKATFTTDGKVSRGSFQGIPTRTTASWTGNTLNLVIAVAGRPSVVTEKLELSSDGQTLTDTINLGGAQSNTIILLKQPDSAGEPVRQPEQLASAMFKDLTTPLKDLPRSQFINTMRYFTFALGKDCQFCHVEGNFGSDEKKEKVMAKKMIAMNVSINEGTFGGQQEVRCYTCHQGHETPPRPNYPEVGK